MPLVLLFIFLLFLSGCTAGEEQGLRIYFLRNESFRQGGLLLFEAEVTLPEGEKEVDFILRELMAQFERDEYRSPFPAGTYVESYGLYSGELRITLSPHYAELTGFYKKAADYCLTLSLWGVGGIEAVSIYCQGVEPSIGLTPESIILADVLNPDECRTRLYFTDYEQEFLRFEYFDFRLSELSETESAPRLILESLLDGPADEMLLRAVPRGLELRSVSTEDGLCTVTLSVDPTAESSSVISARLAIYSMVNSLCELSWVEKVTFLIDGGQPGGYYLLSGTYSFNEAIVNPPSQAKRELKRNAYFYDAMGGTMISIPVKVVLNEDISEELAAIKATINAPSEPNLFNMLSPSDMPGSALTTEGICEINLPRSFFTTREDRDLIEQAARILVYVVTDIPGVEGVTFKMDGEDPVYNDTDLTGIHNRGI